MSRVKGKKLLILGIGLICVLFLASGVVMAQEKVTLTFTGWPDLDRLFSQIYVRLMVQGYNK
jgi:cytochrome b subunit of formate dehydrogenase